MTQTREELVKKQRSLKSELAEVQRQLRALPQEKNWRPMTERQTQVLAWMSEIPEDEWVTPMEIGGSDGSHHSSTLESLTRRGYVEKRRRATLTTLLGGRGSNEYRCTPAGKKALR